jgi:chromosomal replication initiator protein
MRAWEELLATLEKQLGSEVITKWLRPIKIVRFDAANLYLEATPFQRNWFEEHIHPRISHLFRNNNHRPIRIHWENQISKPVLPTPTLSFAGDPLEPTYRLDHFLPIQPIALELAREVVQQRRARFNPIVFFGETGAGKTHLLMGIAAGLVEQQRSVLYLHANTFTEHVVQAIRLSQMQELRKKVRGVDVLLIDDIDQFARKTTTQEEFFHTFNTLHSSDKQIVLSSSQAPHLLQEIEQRLISRFEWGIAVPLPSPSREQVKLRLVEKMRLLKLAHVPEIAPFLLDRFRSSPKAPLHALQVLALRIGAAQQPSVAQMEQLLLDQLHKEHTSSLTSEKIIYATATYFDIDKEALLGKSHVRTCVEPRKVAMYLHRKLLKFSLQKIGRIFHRDHSTVISSIRDVEDAFALRKAPFAQAIETLSQNLIILNKDVF